MQIKLDFVSFDGKKSSKTTKFIGERAFPIQNSYTGQVQCLSHSKDQKFVTSLVQSVVYEGRVLLHHQGLNLALSWLYYFV